MIVKEVRGWRVKQCYFCKCNIVVRHHIQYDPPLEIPICHLHHLNIYMNRLTVGETTKLKKLCHIYNIDGIGAINRPIKDYGDA